MNILLFNNFPPNGTKLCEINKLFIIILNEIFNFLKSIQQYTTQLITMVEFIHIEFITTQKKFKSIKNILNT